MSTADHGTGPPAVGFAAMLRGHRRAAGLTQGQLAERAGVGVRTVRDLESGRAKRPQRGTAVLLAGALDLAGTTRARFEAAARVGGPPSEPVALPPPPDIVGRDDDIDELVKLLTRSEAVVLLGLAGVGKTCLATAVGHHAAGQFPAGVAGITVSEVAGEADLLAWAAAAFAVARTQDLPARFGAERALLVVDGVDQQPAAVMAAVRWLRTYAPGLCLLATSRRPVELPGAVSWPVAPLDADAAAELFQRRLRQVRPEPVTADEEADIAELLSRVGGLPLAIELAAARGRVLTVRQLLSRYRDRVLDLGGAAGPGETLRDAVSASYRLLDAADRAALRQLATLRGRWSVELAEGLLADRSGAEVEALLERLVGLGLVSARGAGEWRFRLLSVVREYAVERSTDAGELIGLRARHASTVAAVVGAVAPRMAGPAMPGAVSTLDALAADVRAALAHAGATDPPTALRLAVATARWCRFRGRDREARALLSDLMADPRTAAADPGLRAAAACARAMLAAAHGEGSGEVAAVTAALQVYRDGGDTRAELGARVLLGRLHLARGELAASRAHAERAMELARSGDRVGEIAVVQRLLARHDVHLGDLANAHRRLATVAGLAVGLGDERLTALATAQLAEVARLDNRHVDCIELGRRAVGRLATYGDPDQRARASATVACALAESGRPDEARPLLAGITCPGLHRLALGQLTRARGDRPGAAALFASAADLLTGRRDVREVIEALVLAVSCTDDSGRAPLVQRLGEMLAGGTALLPRDHLLLSA